MKPGVLISLALVLWAATGCVAYRGPAPLPAAVPPEFSQRPAATPISRQGQLAGRDVAQLQGESHGAVMAVAFSEDGQELAAVSTATQGRLERWRVSDGVLLTSADLGAVWPFVAALDLSASQLAMSYPTHEQAYGTVNFVSAVALWDARTGQRLRQLWSDIDSLARTSYLAFSRDGGSLAYAKNTVRGARNLVSGAGFGTGNTATRCLLSDTICRQTQPTDVIIFDPSAAWLAHADRDGTVMLEESRIAGERMPIQHPFGLTVRKRQPQAARVLALAFDPQRRWLAILDQNALEVYAVRSGRRVLRTEGSTGELGALAFSPDSQLLAVGTAEGLEMWAVGPWANAGRWTEQPVVSMAFSPDGSLLATGDATGGVTLRAIR